MRPTNQWILGIKAQQVQLWSDLMLQPQDLGYPAPISKNLWDISSEEMMKYTQIGRAHV